MEKGIIEEPTISHLIELISCLGDAAKNFVLVGAHAMYFYNPDARRTRDFDFVLDVASLKKVKERIVDILNKLNYDVVPESRNFQFFKRIPNSLEIMRIEFLASEEEKRSKDFRVDIQPNIHARALTGAEIVLKESDCKLLKGSLTDGSAVQIWIRVARLHALAMLKFFAMYDRYNDSIKAKEPEQAKRDRQLAQIHAADVIDIIHGNTRNLEFRKSFWSQFDDYQDLRQRVLGIITKYYEDLSAPGIQLYREFMQRQGKVIDRNDVKTVLREVKYLFM